MPERRLTDYHYEKERFIPRYELLKRLLLDEFSSMPAEEEFLPTQEMLAERYKVSRNTVRRALAKLQREGYIQTSTKTGSAGSSVKILTWRRTKAQSRPSPSTTPAMPARSRRCSPRISTFPSRLSLTGTAKPG